MTTYNLPSESSVNISKGLDNAVGYVATEVSNFTPMFLFTFFMIVFLGGMYKQQKNEGRMQSSAWFAVAGFLTFGLALILSLVDASAGYTLINLKTLGISFVVAVVGGIWFLASDKF